MTYKVTTILFIVLATMLLVVACAPKEQPKEKKETPTVPDTAADSEVSGIESDISAIDALNEELDMSDLDKLDEELAEIEQLDIE